MPATVVCALYKFITLNDYQAVQPELLAFCQAHEVRGTLLLAEEGINGTIAASQTAIDNVLDYLQRDPRFEGLEYKLSFTDNNPFYRMKVKLKQEIVTLGVEGVNPNEQVGQYVEPKDWNDLISDPDVLLIDTRNDYEVAIGSFKGAENPATTAFREFPEYVDQQLDPQQTKKVAMFCTGGIRCEKATALMLKQGFEEVYHLKGGVLKYLEEVPQQDSLWQGECFVFDNRVAVNHDLEPGSYDMCHACRFPITDEDKASPKYQQGVSCPHCWEQKSDADRQRFAQRQHQIELARERQQPHIGATEAALTEARQRKQKQRSASIEQASTAKK